MASEAAFLGIVVALPAEARCLGADDAVPGEIIPIGAHARLVRAGIGRARAEHAASTLIEAGAGALLAWGTAAALDTTVGVGDLVLPGDVVARDGRHLGVDRDWHRRMWALLEPMGRCHVGNLAETDEVLASGDDKLRLHALSGALIADMESAAIADAAAQAGLPVLIIRAVSDTAGMDLPGSALAAVDAGGDVDVLRCMLGLARTPRQLPALIRLAGGFRAACARLAQLARRAEPDFLYQDRDDGSSQA